MADKFCIASGSYGSTAIWSDTDGGSGGASLPTANDNRRFNTSVDVVNFVNPAGYAGTTSVGLGADVSLTLNSVEFLTGTAFENAGTLEVFGQVFFNADSVFKCDAGATTTVTNGYLFFRAAAQLDNVGTIRTSAGLDAVVFQTKDDFARQKPGIVGVMRAQSLNLAASPLPTVVNIADDRRSEIGRLGMVLYDGASDVVLRIFTPMTIGGLWFELYNASGACQIEQHASVDVTGDITRAGSGTANWVVRENATSTFSGTADQVINMPPGVTGQTWTIDKPAGTLDLTNYDGFLQGRVRNLIVRSPSSINLSGQAPYLATEVGNWASYEGIRADCSSRGESRDVADLLRESLDFCDNYGRVVIPSGKTLLTKSFNNRTGARVSGEGTLLVRYGGLVDSGTIDPSIDLRYYDYPIVASLSVLTPAYFGVPFYITTDGSVGKLFRIHWGDATFSETDTIGMRSHVYHYESNVTQRTIRLTVTNEDGSMAITTKTVPITQHPLSVAFSLSPDSGAPPLTVTATVSSLFGKLFTYDWGNGHVTEATESKTESYTYLEPGLYEVTVVATNDENVSMSASRPVTVTPVPAVEFSLVPVRGMSPLTVTATVTSDFGELFTYDWGDGRTTGPTASKTEQATYDVAGFHTVTVTATNAVGAAAQSARTVDVLSYSAVDQPETGRFYRYDGARPARGIPRAGMPWPYRYALAQGECYMSDTLQLFCPMNESGRALQNGSGLYLARVTHADGSTLGPLEIESARYTVFRLDDSDASVRVPVEGHADVALDADVILLSECLVDENWVFDTLGYNFHHVPDDSTYSPFPVAGRNYLVAYELRLKNEIPKVQLQYRVRVV